MLSGVACRGVKQVCETGVWKVEIIMIKTSPK